MPSSTDSSVPSMALRGAHTPQAQAKVVSGQFEAILLKQFLNDSVSSMMGGDNSPSGSVYGYLLTDVLSQKLGASGGMGISKVIEQQLSPRASSLDAESGAKGPS
jgi:flagellar protein FlgJ